MRTRANPIHKKAGYKRARPRTDLLQDEVVMLADTIFGEDEVVAYSDEARKAHPAIALPFLWVELCERDAIEDLKAALNKKVEYGQSARVAVVVQKIAGLGLVATLRAVDLMRIVKEWIEE